MLNDLTDYLISAFDKYNLLASLAFPAFILGIWYATTRFLEERFGSKYAATKRRAIIIYNYLLLAAVGFLAWKDEHGRLSESLQKADAEAKKSVIAIECRITPLPTKPPESGTIQLMNIGMPNDRRLGLGEKFAAQGDEIWAWPKTWATYRCDVTNAGPRAVTNAVMNFEINYEGIYSVTNNAGQEIEVKSPRETRTIRVPLILPGGYFSFYVASIDRARADVDLPEVASIDAANGGRQQVNLVIGRWRDMHLEPPQHTFDTLPKR